MIIYQLDSSTNIFEKQTSAELVFVDTVENIPDLLKTLSSQTEKSLIKKYISPEQTETHIRWHLINNTLLIGEDITELEELKSQIYTLKNIIHKVPGFVFWKDKNLNLAGCNENFARQVGLNHPDEIIGKTDYELPWSEEETKEFHEDDRQIIQTGEPKLNIEETQRQTDGTVSHLLTNKVPTYASNGNINGILGIYIDITDLKNSEIELRDAKEKAESANIAKTEFMANMSHDLKTPLAGIIGLTEILKAKIKKADDLELVSDIHACGRKLLGFFENLFELMRHDKSDLTLIQENFSLEKTINGIADVFRPALRTKNLNLNLKFSDDIPACFHGSRSGYHCIVQNLLDNAIKFTQQGTITLQFSVEKINDQTVKLISTITDSGIGIPDNKLTAIFDRHVRVNPAYQGHYDGSGIGLYIVKKLVSKLNGTINVTSTIGQGSQFKVEMPFTICDLPENNAEQTFSQNSNQTTGAFKVLVIEDNATACKVLEHIFNSLDYPFDFATSGAEAIEKFSHNNYGLVYLDIGLPDMDGYNLARQLRSLDEEKHTLTPVLAVTAHAGIDIQHFCVGAGINGVISKPISMKQVEQTVHKFILNRNIEVDDLIVLKDLAQHLNNDSQSSLSTIL